LWRIGFRELWIDMDVNARAASLLGVAILVPAVLLIHMKFVVVSIGVRVRQKVLHVRLDREEAPGIANDADVPMRMRRRSRRNAHLSEGRQQQSNKEAAKQKHFRPILSLFIANV